MTVYHDHSSYPAVLHVPRHMEHMVFHLMLAHGTADQLAGKSETRCRFSMLHTASRALSTKRALVT